MLFLGACESFVFKVEMAMPDVLAILQAHCLFTACIML